MISDNVLENAVIGGLLVDPSKIPLVSEDDFSNYGNRDIFKALLDMYNSKETIDVLTVHSKKNIDTVTLFDKINSIHSTANLKSDYIPKLKDITLKRKLLHLLENKREQVYSCEKDASEICYDILKSIKDIGTKACLSEWNITTSINELLQSLEDMSKKGVDDKLYLGLKRLDYILAGLHKTDLTILAARPSVGKTAFSFQMARTLAEKGNNVLYVSIEMSDKELLKRLLSTTSGINSNKIRLPHMLKAEDFSKLVSASSEISNLPLVIDDKSSFLTDIVKKCIEMKEQNRLDVVIIDYLQLIRVKDGGETRDQQIGTITRALKALAKELDVPIVVLSQLNRKSEDHSKPTLANLRESGSIEQDADNVIFLHIDKNTSRTDTYIPMEIIVAKQRNGSVGYVEMFFYAKCFKFVEEIPETERQGNTLI